jgi:hypothetical protein
MIGFAQILPHAAEIEEVQRTLFWHKIKCEKQFDRTRIDLNIDARLGEFRLMETEIELTEKETMLPGTVLLSRLNPM